jgi:hypothetical protein
MRLRRLPRSTEGIVIIRACSKTQIGFFELRIIRAIFDGFLIIQSEKQVDRSNAPFVLKENSARRSTFGANFSCKILIVLC